MQSESQLIPYHATDLTGKKVLVLAPHPDDETIGCGGTLALHREAGDPVKVVVLTNGAKGDMAGTWDREAYVRLRREEAVKACACLGVSDLEFWEYEDRGLANSHGAVEKMIRLFERFRPDLVYAPSPLEIHPDHRAVCRLAAEAVRGCEGPFETAFYEIGQPVSVNTLVDITGVVDRKRAALSAYQSQLKERPYDDLSLALSRYRSATLPAGARYGEGFLVWSAEAVRRTGPLSLLLERLKRFAPREPWDRVRVVVSQDETRSRLAGAEQQVAALNAQAAAFQNELAGITRSLSWRVTAPLRFLKRLYNGDVRPGDRKMIKALALVMRHGFKGAYSGLRCSTAGKRTSLSVYGQGSVQNIAHTDLDYRPLISVVVPVFNPPLRYLRACLDSVVHQVYPHWELCIADDASSDPMVKEILRDYGRRFPDRIKTVFRGKNGHICEATNSALELASGEYVAFVDHDDLLTRDALMEVAVLLNEHPDADMIYSDEDKIDDKGIFSEPYFKPKWAPEMFMGQMYTCHLGVYRRALITVLGGLRKGYEGAQDYDLVLRLSELSDKIYHIPAFFITGEKALCLLPRALLQRDMPLWLVCGALMMPFCGAAKVDGQSLRTDLPGVI